MTATSDRIHELLVALGDLLLGWSLGVSQDFAIVVLTLLTTTTVIVARRLTLPANQWRRIHDDLRQLRALRRGASRAGNLAEVQRLDRVQLSIRWLQLRADLRVVLWLLFPLVLLTPWCESRFSRRLPLHRELMTLTAYFPLESIDQTAYLVPVGYLRFHSTYVTRISIDPQDRARARADWRIGLSYADSPRVEPLTIRHGGVSVKHLIRWGDSRPLPSFQQHSTPLIPQTQVRSTEYRFLGIVPGLDVVGMPPWLVAYLGLSLLLSPLVRTLTISRFGAAALPGVRPAVEDGPARGGQ